MRSKNQKNKNKQLLDRRWRGCPKKDLKRFLFPLGFP